MKATAEVVITGAGVSGCSSAYHLSKVGLSDVAIWLPPTLSSTQPGPGRGK